MRLPEALATLRPGAHWYAVGDDVSSVQWLDDPATRPTDAEIMTTMGQPYGLGSTNYRAMIRRRAAALVDAGNPIDAFILLHSIGE